MDCLICSLSPLELLMICVSFCLVLYEFLINIFYHWFLFFKYDVCFGGFIPYLFVSFSAIALMGFVLIRWWWWWSLHLVRKYWVVWIFLPLHLSFVFNSSYVITMFGIILDCKSAILSIIVFFCFVMVSYLYLFFSSLSFSFSSSDFSFFIFNVFGDVDQCEGVVPFN